jgi:hypothetical protein
MDQHKTNSTAGILIPILHKSPSMFVRLYLQHLDLASVDLKLANDPAGSFCSLISQVKEEHSRRVSIMVLVDVQKLLINSIG